MVNGPKAAHGFHPIGPAQQWFQTGHRAWSDRGSAAAVDEKHDVVHRRWLLKHL
jgi:hypothetical protein